jgi:hypothetical protein
MHSGFGTRWPLGSIVNGILQSIAALVAAGGGTGLTGGGEDGFTRAPGTGVDDGGVADGAELTLGFGRLLEEADAVDATVDGSSDGAGMVAKPVTAVASVARALAWVFERNPTSPSVAPATTTRVTIPARTAPTVRRFFGNPAAVVPQDASVPATALRLGASGGGLDASPGENTAW